MEIKNHFVATNLFHHDSSKRILENYFNILLQLWTVVEVSEVASGPLVYYLLYSCDRLGVSWGFYFKVSRPCDLLRMQDSGSFNKLIESSINLVLDLSNK